MGTDLREVVAAYDDDLDDDLEDTPDDDGPPAGGRV
jgi:hypothetical protein